MNVSRVMLVGLVAVVLGARADVKVGDSRQQVIDELGVPQGEIAAGAYEMLTFERGKVELRDGKVAKLELVSVEQLERARELRAQAAVAAEKAAAEARLKRIAEGTEVRKRKLADSAFMLSTASERVSYWQGFKKLYPEIALGDEYTAALKELEQQLALQRVDREREAKVEDLERRVADAEARARQAEQQRGSYVYTEYNYAPAVVALPYWSHRCSSLPCGVCTPSHRSPHRAVPVQPSLISTPFDYGFGCDRSGISVGYRSPGLTIQFNGR